MKIKKYTTQSFLFIFIIGCQSINYQDEIEQKTGINFNEDILIKDVESLNGIGEGGLVVDFQILNDSEIKETLTQIKNLEYFLITDPNSRLKSARSHYWYKKNSRYIFESNQLNPLISVYIDSITGEGKYSYFEE